MYKIKLSPYAKIFYTEWLLEPSSFRYNVAYVQILYGKLDEQRLKKALIRYVDGYLLLNSHIQDVDGEPHWVRNESISELEYLDYPVSNSELLSYVTHGFDLYNGPLYKFRLIRISDDVYKFIVVLHHLVMDGSSLDFGVFEEISNYYNDEKYTIKYSIEDQIRLITNLTDTLSAKLEQNKVKYEEFWRQHLLNVENIDLNFLKLGEDYKEEDTIESYNPIAEIRFSFGDDELDKLNQIKLKYSITPYVYGQCIFALLLRRYTSQEKLAISYPVAIKEGIDFIYGAQLNINLIVYNFDYDTTIIKLLNQSKEFFQLIKQEDVRYGYYPVTDLLCANTNIDRHLLDISFIQAPFRDKLFEFDGIKRVEVSSELNVDSVPKEMLLFEQEIKLRNNKLNYRVRYDKRTFDQELLNNFITSYKKIFLEVLEDLLHGNEAKLISDYKLLDDAQYKKIVCEFNQTDRDYPRDKTIHQLFEEQVLKTPNNVAVLCEDVKLTYQELNQKANQLANYLKIIGVKVGEIVGIYLSRSLDFIIAILSVLKVGAAYLPLNISDPLGRIQQMIMDCSCCLCLTNDELHKQFAKMLAFYSSDQIKILCINGVYKNSKPSPLLSIAFPKQDPMSKAYVMYTSASTGEPKGVEVSHRAVIRLVKNTNYIVFEKNDRVAHAASVTFDASTFEIWGALLNGLPLIIIPKDILLDLEKTAQTIEKHVVNIMWLTSSLFNTIVYINPLMLANLRYLFIGGEELNPQKLHQFFLGNKITKLINGYGPTESTTFAATFEIPSNWSVSRKVFIGKPIANTTVYVLDHNLQLLPIGVIGELHIGGDGVALGYRNNHDLTVKKFIHNPFQTYEEKLHNKNSRLYKTGDLARLLPDGNLEYIGRDDFQVKIRGYRIELGEIESKLGSCPEVKQCVVLAKECDNPVCQHINNKYLIAYYVADKKLDEIKIYNYLQQQLPEYMLPSALIYLNKLPLTTNGKLDRASLPEPKFENQYKYVAPKNEQEKLICRTFAQVLGVEKIGVNDDFFKFGGNSLKAIALTAHLQANFDIKVADIFNLRTPSKLAEYAYFGKNVLQQKLEMVKSVYKNKSNKKTTVDDGRLRNNINHYLENIGNLRINYSLLRPIANILLTGATGYLGCNILKQLLQLTNYKIFLLIRANSQKKAINRINRKFQFYFDKTLNNVYGSRVFVINADIEKSDLGLSSKEYNKLISQIDSVIHAAALVKHYGEYDKFYSANVKATINLLEFTKLTKLKDFHYISTYSVLNCGFVPNCDEYTYTEDDLPDNLQQWDNVYVQTKLQGERQVIKYRSCGVNSNIYRVGNLAFIAENYRAQENIEENAFFNWIKCLFKMKGVAQELNLVEVSPVDLTAQAIVKLFDKKQLENNIYHVFNPYLFNISDVFLDNRISPVASLTMEQFVDNIVSNLSNNVYHDLIERFLLHQGWLDGWNVKNTTSITVLQDRTKYILKQLDFEWPPITSAIFNKYLELLKLYGVNEMTKKAKILEHLDKVAQDIPILFYWLDMKQRYLGVNKHCIRVSGATSFEKDFAGKTPYDIYPKEMADNIVQHHEKVVKTGKTISMEESIKDVTTGEIKYFNGTISPLYDDGEMLGTIGTAIDITAEKKEAERLKKVKIFDNLEKIAQLSPTLFYWLDLDQKYLGINKHCLKASGTTSYEKDFADKTPYDVFPKEMAENIVQHHKQVIQTGEILSAEESIKDVTTGEVKYFNASISPLCDDNEKIIGTVGVSIDITEEKKEAERLKTAKVFEHLEKIAQLIPVSFYWLDIDNTVLGINEQVLKDTGASAYSSFVGKTPYELYPKEMADNIVRANEEIVKTGKVISQEEPIKDITTGRVRYFNAIKAPLRDDYGKIIGTFGFSIETTAEKEAERLKLEAELQQAQLEEHEKFAKIADQVAHDIRSPLSSLAMIIKACEKDLPEALRISLRDAATNIGDIANNLSSRYSPAAEKDERGKKEARQPVLVSLALLQLLTDKKYQYKDLPVKFSSDFSQDSNFAFIKMEPTAFKRMLSNLVNNAVDAFEGKVGKVSLKLSADKELVKIVIQDNGKGIPPKVLDKIRNNIAVTHGKQDGHGIGLTQVSETLQRNGGEFVIESKVGKGTKITLTFSRIANPEWIAEEICLKQGDTIVILDDDSSIHGAWEIRFKDYADIVKLQHFTFGEDAVKFIRAADKDKIVLLTDFELLKQELNGLHVVEQTQVPRSILVTSHFNNQTVRDLANKFDTKILPKQLASEVPIRLIEENVAAADIANLKQVDVVIIEDNKLLADGLAMAFKVRGKTADVYYSGRKFLENFTQYAKDTKICTDYSLGSLTGVDIAKKLHEAGYTNLCLFSGWDFDKDEIPDYLTVISKSDMDLTKKIIGE